MIDATTLENYLFDHCRLTDYPTHQQSIQEFRLLPTTSLTEIPPDAKNIRFVGEFSLKDDSITKLDFGELPLNTLESIIIGQHCFPGLTTICFRGKKLINPSNAL